MNKKLKARKSKKQGNETKDKTTSKKVDKSLETKTPVSENPIEETSEEKTSEEIATEETTVEKTVSEEITEETSSEETKPSGSSLDDDWTAFEESKSEFKPEREKEPVASPSFPVASASAEISEVDKIKIRIFFGLCCHLLEGFHAFMYEMITKYEISTAEMKLEEHERNQILQYLYRSEVVAFINKINPLWWAVIHTEYIFFLKFQNLKKTKTKKQPKKKEKEK